MRLTKKFDISLGYGEKLNIDSQINLWLEKHNYILIDVKYNVTDKGYESALVIYDNSENKDKSE